MDIKKKDMFSKYWVYCILSLCFLSFIEVWGQDADNSNGRLLELDSLVRHGRLDNGFTYYLRKTDIPSNSVEFHMVVKAGTYHEDEDQLGYSHLLEHMGFKGTKHFPNTKEYFRKAGRRIHAGTGNDHTFYYTRLRADRKEELKNGLQLLRDWAQDILFTTKSLKVERGAVIGEMRVNDPYGQWMSDTINELVIKDSGHYSQDMKKYKLNIKNFNEESFMRFYNDWYRPDLEAAIIVGDIDIERMEAEVKRLFSDLEMPKKPKNAKERVEAQRFKLRGKNHFASVRDTLNANLRLNILFKQPNFSFNPRMKADYKSLLLQELYWILLERNKRNLEQLHSPSFSRLSFNYRKNQLGGGQILASRMIIDFETDDLEYVRKGILSALIDWKRLHIGFTSSELRKAKEQLLQKYSPNANNDPFQLIQKYKYHFIRGTAAPNPHTELQIVMEVLQKITLEEVQDFMRNYSDPNKNTNFLFFKGKDQKVPEFTELKKWIKKINLIEVSPLEAMPPPITSLADEVPLVQKAEAGGVEVTRDLLGISTTKLKNGMKLVFKPTEPRSEQFANSIRFQAFRTINTPVYNREQYLVTQTLPEILKYTGSGSYSRFELDRFMKNKNLRLDFRATKDSQIMYGQSQIANLDELLTLLQLYTTGLTLDPDGFSAWKAFKKEQLAGFGSRSSSLFINRKIEEGWYPDIPRFKLEDLEILTRERILNASNEWFSDLSSYTFIFTGDFQTDKLLPEIVQMLSVFPGKKQQRSSSISSFEYPLKKMDETIYLNNINQAYVNLYFPIKTSKDIKTQIELKLISKALGELIFRRLRDGCYAPNAGGTWVDNKNGVYAFRIKFNSELGDEQTMLSYALEEFNKLKEEGVSKEWLDIAIADELNDYEKGFSDFGYSNFWSDYIQEKIKNEEKFSTEILQYGTMLEHFIKIGGINTTARKYMTQENLQQFITLPNALLGK